MRLFIFGFAAVTVAAVATATRPPTDTASARTFVQIARPPRLFKDSRQQIAVARAQGRADITLVVATVMGRTADAAKDAIRFGGDVRYRDDTVGYLRVKIPLDQATPFAESPNVEAAAADADDTYPTRLTPNGSSLPIARGGDLGRLQAATEQWPPRAGAYPLLHPYSPLQDLDAAGFRAQNPTFDGRGVTIALLDGNIDPLLPECQTAYAIDGKRIPTFADYLNVTDPRDDADLTPQWVDMRAQGVGRGAAKQLGLTVTTGSECWAGLKMSPFLRDIMGVLPSAVPGDSWGGCVPK